MLLPWIGREKTKQRIKVIRRPMKKDEKLNNHGIFSAE
jgi:DUF917 family protein